MGCSGCGRRKRQVITSAQAQEMQDAQAAEARPRYKVIAKDGTESTYTTYVDARRAQKETNGRLVNLL